MQEMTNGIRIQDVQVLDIQPSQRQMAVSIAMDCKTHEELNLISSRIRAGEKLQNALRYLLAEGFIAQPFVMGEWRINVYASLKTTCNE